MTTRVTVIRAGSSTLQDLGRPGLAFLGVPAGGAADQHAARTANALVGNADGAVHVEVTASELVLQADHDLLLSVTGAAECVWVDQRARPSWELLAVHAGEQVRVPPSSTGMRSYVAVNGAIEASTLLGSAAPDPLLEFIPRLEDGDLLEVCTALDAFPTTGLPLFRLGAGRPRGPVDGISTVAVTSGPDLHLLGGLDRLGGVFAVTSESNAVGLRLSGQSLGLAGYPEILSQGVPVGAVQVPPSGDVIVLLRARLVTSGYPVVAVATAGGTDVLGQVRPGDTLRFRPSSTAAAVATLRARDDAHRALTARVHNALTARGLSQVLQRTA